MTQLLEVTSRPSIRFLAEPLTKLAKSPSLDEPSLRAALIGETLRIALFTLYNRSQPGSPVHPLALRAWVRHKLGPIVPKVMDEGEGNFREVLCEGRGANLEFLGDALLLSNGYLCPAPTRLVQVGPSDNLLLSGVPTNLLGPLTQYTYHSALGRRVDGFTVADANSMTIPVQRLEEYLGRPEGVPSPQELISSVLSRGRSTWAPGKEWRAYVGNLEVGSSRTDASYGFSWVDPNDSRGRRPASVDSNGVNISIWREPLTERFYHYWVAGRINKETFGIVISNTEWKQACIAVDSLAGRPREATFARDTRRSGILLSLGFQPFELLYRALHALGARFDCWRPGAAQWELPSDAKETIKHLLERVGVRTRVIGG